MYRQPLCDQRQFSSLNAEMDSKYMLLFVIIIITYVHLVSEGCNYVSINVNV